MMLLSAPAATASVYAASVSRTTPYGSGLPRHVTGRRNRMVALALWHDHNGRCGRCGLPIHLGLPFTSRYALTIGHIVPVSLGGTNDPSNLRPEHRGCNLSAGNRPVRPLPVIVVPS